MDESSLDFKVLPAEESHAEELARLYLAGYSGKYSLEEFTNPESIRKAIRERIYCWMVGINEGRVIASSVGVMAHWNNSFEHGRAVVYPVEFRRKNVIQTLISAVVSACLAEGCDIGWLGMREDKGVAFSEKNELGLVGFFPGAHKVKVRENHLLYVVKEGCYRTRRATNAQIMQVYAKAVEYVEDALGLKKFGLLSPPVEYPPDVVVGDQKGLRIEEKGFRLSYQTEPKDGAIVIGNIETASDQIGVLLDVMLRAPLNEGEYVQVDVLADKFEAHERLKGAGFEMCAFIPAWFLKGGRRYDCVRFAKHSPSVSLDEQIESRVDRLREVYTGR
jgi:hypothetical protein